ncbi:Ribonuclease 3 [subsurface metagenome]
MNPKDPNYSISDKELSECIEALLGANYQIFSLSKSTVIVEKLMQIVDKNDFYDSNPKGELIKIFQKNGQTLIFPDAKRVGGEDHTPLYSCTIKEVIFEKEFHIMSDKFSRKVYAEQDAAQKFLFKLGLTNKKSIGIKSERKKEILKSPSQSLSNEDLMFSKSTIGGGYFNTGEFQLSSGTGETLYDYAIRKSKKKPFSTLLLLNARLDDVSGSSWHLSISNGELILLNMRLYDKDYFEISFAESKNKAKKEAARKFIENSNLLEWLKDNYGDKRV